jgi:hypothetical protein
MAFAQTTPERSNNGMYGRHAVAGAPKRRNETHAGRARAAPLLPHLLHTRPIQVFSVLARHHVWVKEAGDETID